MHGHGVAGAPALAGLLGGLLQRPAAELGGAGALVAAVHFGHPEELVRGEEDALGRPPAGLGADGGDPTAGQLDDRLVEQRELAVVQGGAQPADGLRAADDVGLHLRGVQLDAALSGLLRAVHREVGVAHEGAGGDVGLGEGDADAGRDADLGAALDQIRLGEGDPQPVGDLEDAVLAGGGVAGAVADDERGELVAAEAGRGVPGADGVLEPAGGLDQQLVAGLVADGVVDGLEAVEVDEEHGGARVGDSPAGEGLLDALGEQGAVGQVGERVVLGGVLQLGLEPDPFGDVTAVEDQAAVVAVDGGLDVEPFAAAGAEAALDARGGLLGGRRGEEAAHLVDDAAEVLRVDERGQFGADELLGVPAVDPGGGGADVAQYPGGRGDHDDVAGALHQGAEVVLLLGQFLGEGDVVEEHDALADDERQDDRAAREEHDAVDVMAVQDVVEDAEGADGGREVRGEGGEGAGDGPAGVRERPTGPGGRLVALLPGHPGRVGHQHVAREPAGVEDLPGAVIGLQQRRGEQRVAQDGQGEGRDGGVDRGAVGRGALEVQREHHGHQHDVQQRIGERERGVGDALAGEVRGVGERQAPGEREQRAADQPGVEREADPAGPGDRAAGEHQQADDGGRREEQEAEVGRGRARDLLGEHDLVPAPDEVADAGHRGGGGEQQPGGAEAGAARAAVPEAGDGGEAGGAAEPEVAHGGGELGRAPAEGGTRGVAAADEGEEQLGEHARAPARGGPAREHGSGGAHRAAVRGRVGHGSHGAGVATQCGRGRWLSRVG